MRWIILVALCVCLQSFFPTCSYAAASSASLRAEILVDLRALYEKIHDADIQGLGGFFIENARLTEAVLRNGKAAVRWKEGRDKPLHFGVCLLPQSGPVTEAWNEFLPRLAVAGYAAEIHTLVFRS